MRRGIAVARGALALTGVLQVLADRRYRKRPAAHLAVGLAIAQLVHDDLAFRSGDAISLRRARWLSPTVTALIQVVFPQLPSDNRTGSGTWIYNGGIWVAPAVALAGGRWGPVAGSVSQLPQAARAVRSPELRAYLLGNHLSVGFLTIAFKLLGESGTQAKTLFDQVGEERRASAESEAAVASLRQGLIPALAGIDELIPKVQSAGRSEWLGECRQLEDAARSLQQGGGDADATRKLVNRLPQWDADVARDELAKRMRRVAGVAYGASTLWCGVACVEAARRGLIGRWSVVAATGLSAGLSAWGMLDRGPMLTGERAALRTGRSILNGVLGGGLSAALHRSASSPGFDTSVRDQIQVQGSALANSASEVAVSWTLSTAIGGYFEFANTRVEERPALVALTAGYSWGVPQALHLLLSGIWDAQREADQLRSTQVDLAARRGQELGAEWAARASHDYVAQSLLYLRRNPELAEQMVLAVLRDARTKLEQALNPQEAPTRRDIVEVVAECVGGYTVFGLHAELAHRSSDEAGPKWQVDDVIIRALLLGVNQGLSNVLAHSQDTRPLVELTSIADGVRLRIINQTATEPLSDAQSSGSGFGLKALNDAVGDLGGRCDFSVDGSLAVLKVEFPFGSTVSGMHREV